MNPALRELGFSPSDRVVVVHADDIGMCHSTLPAIEELMAGGVVTSASAMVPCRWFRDVVAWRTENPHSDLGVHLTLTSEWDSCQWRPVSTCSQAGGLMDVRGFFHRATSTVRNDASRSAVRTEMHAQLERAEHWGLAPSHIDNHMHVVMCDEFLEDYLQLGFARGLPAFLPRVCGNLGDSGVGFQECVCKYESRGMPVFDCFTVVTGKPSELRDEQVRAAFDHLPAGLSCVLLHPAIDTAELRDVATDWRARVADFEAFRNPTLLDYLHRLGIQLISYQPLRDAMESRR